jgi:hypothetical protein
MRKLTTKMAAAILAGLSLLSVPGTPAARGDDQQDQMRQMYKQQKAQQETYINRLDLIPGKKRIAELIAIGIEDGKLVIKSPLFTDDAANKMKNRQMRADVEGFPGFCTIMVQPIGNGAYYFTFNNVDYPELLGQSNVSVSMQQGYLQISRNFNSRTKSANINLVQTSGRAIYGQPDGVQLNVYAGDNAGRMNVSVNLQAADFVSLRRKYPREVNEHLRPMLRDLKLENVFAVDPTTAWQVFNDEWKGNAAVAAQVKSLLDGLERDAYADRERARQAIRKLGPDAALEIYRMDRADLSPEQNCQLDAVVAAHVSMSRAEAAKMADDVDFLLDCLYSDDATIRAVSLKHLERVTRKNLGFDPAEEYNARVVRVEALRAELSPKKPATTQRAKT